jgi:outer membrane translocation and assembly module TamA
VQITPELRGFLPLSSDLVLAARARAGAFYGEIPPTERYFSGGATTQRGFSERRLAPTLFGAPGQSPSSVPVGGGGLFESNLELRARLGTIRKMGVGGVVFLDGADVRERFADLDFGNLHWAAGAGVRVFTLVGAVRFDVGYRLNRTGPMEPEPNSHYAFHLSLGEAY